MIMEHIVITELQDGYFRLAPETGYQLMNKKSGRLYSEVVTKEQAENDYVAVEI